MRCIELCNCWSHDRRRTLLTFVTNWCYRGDVTLAVNVKPSQHRITCLFSVIAIVVCDVSICHNRVVVEYIYPSQVCVSHLCREGCSIYVLMHVCIEELTRYTTAFHRIAVNGRWIAKPHRFARVQPFIAIASWDMRRSLYYHPHNEQIIC